MVSGTFCILDGLLSRRTIIVRSAAQYTQVVRIFDMHTITSFLKRYLLVLAEVIL